MYISLFLCISRPDSSFYTYLLPVMGGGGGGGGGREGEGGGGKGVNDSSREARGESLLLVVAKSPVITAFAATLPFVSGLTVNKPTRRREGGRKGSFP